jgi:hypothetical protein
VKRDFLNRRIELYLIHSEILSSFNIITLPAASAALIDSFAVSIAPFIALFHFDQCSEKQNGFQHSFKALSNNVLAFIDILD